MNGRKNAIIRLVVTAILFVNAMLTIAGKSPIPFNEESIKMWIDITLSGLTIIWSWWKNANITKNALAGQVLKDKLTAEDKGKVSVTKDQL